jgi:hypothetical protein
VKSDPLRENAQANVYLSFRQNSTRFHDVACPSGVCRHTGDLGYPVSDTAKIRSHKNFIKLKYVLY